MEKRRVRKMSMINTNRRSHAEYEFRNICDCNMDRVNNLNNASDLNYMLNKNSNMLITEENETQIASAIA